MNARDKLAKLLFIADNSNAKDPEAEWADVTHESQGPHHTQYVYDMAGALIAAGYVKHRTITTIEELDALGRMSTVLASNGCVWINDGDAADQWASLVEFDPIWRCSADVELPATVLHEGGAA